MDIDQLAASAGVTVEEIKILTDHGLLDCAVSEGGETTYPDSEVAAVALVLDGQRAQLSIDQIHVLVRILRRDRTVLPWDLDALGEITAAVESVGHRDGALAEFLMALAEQR